MPYGRVGNGNLLKTVCSHGRCLARFRVGTFAFFMLLALASPILAESQAKSFTLKVEDLKLDIGGGMTYAASTFDGTVPGPLVRVAQGDKVTIKLTNHTTSAHGIDIYAAQIAPNAFTGDPGREVSYNFRAAMPGVFAYHCSAIPVLRHVADGMYGMAIVDPLNGWPNGKAHEIMLVQGEFYGTPDKSGFIAGDSRAMIEAKPNFVVFNGAVNKYDVENPIPIKVGEPVRIFFLNAGPNLTSTFHVSGVIFSTVYQNGNPADALHNLSSLQVGPGSGAVFEFTVTEPGDYQFADQAMAHPYKGAIGVMRAK